MSKSILSPCVKVCKFTRDGYCIACGMSERQKKHFKKLKGRKKQLRFIEALQVQQQDLGGFPMWPRAYQKRCRKKGVAVPDDLRLTQAAPAVAPPMP